MKSQSVVPQKKRGPPATGKGESTNVRLLPHLQAAMDAWIAARPDPKPTRPEAIRHMIALATGLPLEATPTIDEKIAETKLKLSKVEVPKKPSPEKGMALLRKGYGENKLRALKAKKKKA